VPVLLREPGPCADLLEELPADQAASIVTELPSNEQADVLGRLDESEAEAILDRMAPAGATSARRLLRYEPDTAGGRSPSGSRR
jgi:magnesium transporter